MNILKTLFPRRAVAAIVALLIAFFAFTTITNFPVFAAGADDFIITVRTNNPGTSGNNQFTIPIDSAYTYNYDIEWGDGTTDTGITGSTTHTYATAGTYQLRISGTFPGTQFSFSGDQEKIISLDQWGTGTWQKLSWMFNDAVNMVYNATDEPDLSVVTDLSLMFRNASSFDGNLNSWDVSTIQNFSSMFNGASSFNGNIVSWNTGSATDMSFMFAGATAFNRGITGWNTGNVQSMWGMFRNASSFNQNLGGWNVSSVSNMESMFEGASSFNGNISGWNTGNVTNMFAMLYQATAFNQNLSAWDVADVTNMTFMMNGVTLTTSNYDNLLNGWDALSLEQNVVFDAGNSEYCNGSAARANMIANDNWTIADGGEENGCSATDTTAPVITLNGASTISLTVGDTYNELGATATDNVDGNITGSIVITGSVNTAVAGTYTRFYNVSDAAGNDAVQVTRTVIVSNAPDTTAPVITLNGASTISLTVGDTYNELGATATDNVDGNITGSIVITGSVNTAVAGTYTIFYNVSDAAGNNAVQVTRTINVTAAPDTTPPQLQLNGSSFISLTVGDTYTELGARALDNVDGVLDGSIVITGSVNTAVAGTYTRFYNVSDSSGNAAPQLTRTISVAAAADTTAPVITLNGANPQIIEVGGSYVELGATATDNVDGNITGSIVINSSSVNTGSLGSYVVTYNVTDAAGNSATQVTRTVTVVDTTAPVITLNGSAVVEVFQGGAYSEPGYTATDNVDGVITGSVVVDSSAVNTAVLGSYPITYNVSDSSGNDATQVTRTINVVVVPDTTAPVLTLIGADPQEIVVGNPYVELGATAFDAVDGNLTGSIIINSSNVNTSTVGSYTVGYLVADAAGNSAFDTRTVSVVPAPDTQAPVISLLGNNPLSLFVGDTYVEPGATATDNVDGNLSSSVVITGSVNTAVAGTYTLFYNVSDAAGNSATQVTRTVIVNTVPDTTAPIITLNGSDPQQVTQGSAYIEAGATVIDDVDGDISNTVQINSSSVNTAVLGSYPVTYDASDSSGNNAIQVTRTVTVVTSGIDTTPPIITITGANPQVITEGDAYVELGATAFDVVDGNLTGSIVINSSNVNTNVVGSYVVGYSVADAAGNNVIETRTVSVVAAPDTTPPVLTLAGLNPQEITAGDSYVELGATAFDAVDGNLTNSIVIDTSNVNTLVAGTYSVFYSVTDAAGNSSSATRTVNVIGAIVDIVAPVITVVGANPQNITIGDTYVELGATALDDTDGNLTGSIVVDSSSIDTNTLGAYTVTYSVSDAAGNNAVESRTVNVVGIDTDATAPVVTVLGANPQTITRGDSYVELGATALDNIDGVISTIDIDTSGVVIGTVGTYQVIYSATDAAGNTGSASRVLNVVAPTTSSGGGGGGSSRRYSCHDPVAENFSTRHTHRDRECEYADGVSPSQGFGDTVSTGGGTVADLIATIRQQIFVLQARIQEILIERGLPTDSIVIPGLCSDTFTQPLVIGNRDGVGGVSQVLLLQQELARQGYYNGPQSGFFGFQTQTALTAWQEANAATVLTPLGLSQGTGAFYPSSRRAMNAQVCNTTPSLPVATTPNPTVGITCPYFTQPLVLTDRDGVAGITDVLKLQQELARQGYYNGPQSGFFGFQTQTALTAWQEANAATVLTPLGLSQGTGAFYPSSRTVMNNQVGCTI